MPGQEKTFYEVLGLTPAATADEIKAAYRTFIRRGHVDKVKVKPDASAEEKAAIEIAAKEKTQALNDAYTVLSDTTYRRIYDSYLRVADHSIAARAVQESMSKQQLERNREDEAAEREAKTSTTTPPSHGRSTSRTFTPPPEQATPNLAEEKTREEARRRASDESARLRREAAEKKRQEEARDKAAFEEMIRKYRRPSTGYTSTFTRPTPPHQATPNLEEVLAHLEAKRHAYDEEFRRKFASDEAARFNAKLKADCEEIIKQFRGSNAGYTSTFTTSTPPSHGGSTSSTFTPPPQKATPNLAEEKAREDARKRASDEAARLQREAAERERQDNAEWAAKIHKVNLKCAEKRRQYNAKWAAPTTSTPPSHGGSTSSTYTAPPQKATPNLAEEKAREEARKRANDIAILLKLGEAATRQAKLNKELDAVGGQYESPTSVELSGKLRQLYSMTRDEILDLFTELKKHPNECLGAKYAFIHKQRHKTFDSFRMFFVFSHSFWHTNRYQKVIKHLKNAYLLCDKPVSRSREYEEGLFIDYRRSNAPIAIGQTTTRKAFDSGIMPKR